MSLVNLSEALRHAEQDNYAIGSYNINNLNIMNGILEAAESQRSPVILAFAEVHFKYMDFELLMSAAVRAAHRANVPVVLHLDHGLSLEAIVKAIRFGMSSIMVDASMRPLEDNIKIVQDVVKICHPLGISVEAELGCVGGEEGEGEGSEVDTSKFTDPVQAVEFVRQTNIDALAIAFGNVHGRYKGKPELKFPLLGQIRTETNRPIVLHGGSGISDEDFQKAISLGVRKINFYTKNSLDSHKELAAYVKTNPFQKGEDIGRVWNIIKEVYKNNAIHNMQIWGSSGKA